MTQIATVEKILPGGKAEISVPRKSACGHDCEECAGCGVSGASVRAVARNDIGAAVGQKVVVESSTTSARRDEPCVSAADRPFSARLFCARFALE